MKIKTVKGTNVKGLTFSHDLKPVNIIVGANAKGKTAVLKAIDIALTPKIAPASYPSIAPLFEGFPKMETFLDTDVGQFSRTFKRSGDKVSMESEERPDDVTIPPVALDADVYFGLSIDKRTTFVASLVKLPDSFSEQAVIAELKNRLKLPDDRNTETTQGIVNDIMGTIEDSADVIRHAGVSVQDWLAQQILTAQGRQKTAKDTKQRMTQSAQASVQIQLAQPGDDQPDSIVAIESAINVVAGEVSALSESIGKLKAEKDADVGERDRKAANRLRLTADYNATTDQSETILATKKKIQDIDTEVSAYESKTPNVSQLISNKFIEREKFSSTNHSLASETARLKSIIAGVDTRLCENCQQILKGDSVTNLTDTEDALASNHLTIRNLDADIAVLEKQATKSRAEDIRINDLRKQLPQLNQALRTAENAQQKRTSLHEQLQATGQESGAVSSRDYDNELVTLDTKLTDANQRNVTLRDRLKKATASAQQNARKAQEDAERAKAVDDYELQTISVDVLKEFQSKMVEAAFEMLLLHANKIATTVLSTPLAYKDGDLGRYDLEQRWVAHKCFSDAERSATYTALSFALGLQSGHKFVRVDNLNWLDNSNRRRFIERILQMVHDGDIDQFIGADTSLLPYTEVEGVNVITLG